MKDYPEKTSEHYGGVWNEAEAIQQGSITPKIGWKK